MKPCTTHHHACDCREAVIQKLFREIVLSHRINSDTHYNECEKPGQACQFCSEALRLYPNLLETK
jgi:hypothetical protein